MVSCSSAKPLALTSMEKTRLGKVTVCYHSLRWHRAQHVQFYSAGATELLDVLGVLWGRPEVHSCGCRPDSLG